MNPFFQELEKIALSPELVVRLAEHFKRGSQKAFSMNIPLNRGAVQRESHRFVKKMHQYALGKKNLTRSGRNQIKDFIELSMKRPNTPIIRRSAISSTLHDSVSKHLIRASKRGL